MFAPRWFQGFWNEHWKLVCMISGKDISGLCSSPSPPQSPQRSQVWWGVGFEVRQQTRVDGRILGLKDARFAAAPVRRALAGFFLGCLWLTLLWNSHVLGFCSRATEGSPPEQSRPSWGCSQLGEESGSEPVVTGRPRAPVLQSCSQTPRLWVQQTPGPQLLPWEQRATTLGPRTSHRKASDFFREMLAGSFIN